MHRGHLLAAMALAAFCSTEALACTVMLATAGATAEGRVIVGHSNDGFGSDPNVVWIPARDYPPGSERPVYPSAAAVGEMPEYNSFDHPYLVAPERAPGLDFPDRPRTKALGTIPQATHTYAYLDADYPILNEHGLMLAECTDLSARAGDVSYAPEEGLFYSAELGRVALERCRTAREAIALMGSLIDEYGLWGTAESLIVADSREGWLLEMCPWPGHRQGWWIAERIPDGQFLVAANQLRIRAIRPDDADQLYHPDLVGRLEAAGWLRRDAAGRPDWLLSLEGREYVHPYYSLRRIWTLFNAVAPSRHFPSEVENWDSAAYPLSVTPDEPLTLARMRDLFRNHYQGTRFDKSKSPLSGLFGSPFHYGNEKGERAVLTAKSSLVYLAESGGDRSLPLAWVAINNPGDSPFVPLAVTRVPEAYTHVLRDTYEPEKMFWISSAVMALHHGFYNVMHPQVAEALARAEQQSDAVVARFGHNYPESFQAALADNAGHNIRMWQELYVRLLCLFDGGAGVEYAQEVDPATPAAYAVKPARAPAARARE